MSRKIVLLNPVIEVVNTETCFDTRERLGSDFVTDDLDLRSKESNDEHCQQDDYIIFYRRRELLVCCILHEPGPLHCVIK